MDIFTAQLLWDLGNGEFLVHIIVEWFYINISFRNFDLRSFVWILKSVYNHLQLVSRLAPGCDYMFFKKDIPPMWEDPHNCDGGRWIFNLEKKFRTSSLDVYWLNTVIDTHDIINSVICQSFLTILFFSC